MNRGFALLIVLWLLVPIALLMLLLSGTARSDAQLGANLRDAAILQAAADGGIETAIFALAGPAPNPQPLRLRIAGADVAVRMTSLSGLINPNLVSQDLLRTVLIRLRVEPAAAGRLSAAIVDWRTPPNPQTPVAARTAPYLAAGRAYGPPDAPFETIEELRDVLGMTPELLAALKPYLTLYTERPPDPDLAPPLVRDALADTGTARQGGVPALGTVFEITADATGSRTQARRQATVKLGPSDNLRPFRVLAWR